MFWNPVTMVFNERNGRSSTRSDSTGKPLTATYHTRDTQYAGTDGEAGDAAFSAYGKLYGHVERRLFSKETAGQSTTSLMSEYLQEHRILARMFNAVRVSLGGKVRRSRSSRSSVSTVSASWADFRA